MKEKIKNMKGITLVALIITIIVLLILAVVAITSISNSNIIKHAQNATTQHIIAAEKEAIQLGYSVYQIELAQKGTAELKVEGATVTSKGEYWNVKFTKTNNEYELKKDGTITLTKQGNGSTETVGWKDNGDDTFTKGEVTVKVGDIVNYDEGKDFSTTVTAIKSGCSNDQTYTTENLGWRVLGINTKGELELISDNPTSSLLILKGETGYLNVEDVLNNMCNELYGNGEHAAGARSLNIEDINKLGNYNPTTYSGYGDIWTYRFPTSGDYMQYKRTKADGTLLTDWTEITNSNCQKFRILGETETISTDDRSDTGKSLENTYYAYDVADIVKQTTSDGKKMSDIISNGTYSKSIVQFLANSCIDCYFSCAVFKIRYIGVMSEWDGELFYSDGEEYGFRSKVRPVVTLKSNIQLVDIDKGRSF